MSPEQVRAQLRASVYQAIATLGEKEARDIAMSCLDQAGKEHYNQSSSGEGYEQNTFQGFETR